MMARAPRILMAVLALMFLAPIARADMPPAAPAAPGGYASRLSHALAAARAARHASGTTRATEIARALALLPRGTVVRVGTVEVQPDLTPIRDDLATAGRDARRLDDAVDRLEALRGALDTPSARASAPDARHLAALDRILHAPPFVSTPNLWTGIADFIDRLLSRSPLGSILDALSRFLGGLVSGPGSGRAATTVITIAAGLIVAVALVFVANRAFHPFAPLATESDDPLGLEAGLTRVDAAGARGRAATLAAAGQYREAVRYLYLATLLALDESGRLRIDEATGNRDILRQARATPRLAEALSPVVRLFDLFLFGHAPVTRDDYEHYRQLSERVLQTPQQTTQAPAPPAAATP